MTAYRIVCTEQSDNCPRYGHILAVGTGGPEKANERWTVRQVYAAMDRGDTFYTADAYGKTARVHKYDCPCGRGSLRSSADATRANNLDDLRVCRFPAA